VGSGSPVLALGLHTKLAAAIQQQYDYQYFMEKVKRDIRAFSIS
jgi:hypothetical protein